MKNSHKIIQVLKNKGRVQTRELKNAVSVGDRGLYKILALLIKEKKIVKYGRPPYVFYSLNDDKSIAENFTEFPYSITKQKHIKELIKRVPPVLNINCVVLDKYKYLIGVRSKKQNLYGQDLYLFPGGRMRFDEGLQQAAYRILHTEVPGIEAHLRSLITALTDYGVDIRSNNVNLYYLFEFKSGNPSKSHAFDNFYWLTAEEIQQNKNILALDKSLFKEINHKIIDMHNNQDELLVEVDLEDKEVGQITKREAHSTNRRGHRAAHIIVYNSKGEVILQQRSWHKLTEPLKWDIFGGHQVYGQTIDQCAQAELYEELGVSAELYFVGKTCYRDDNQLEWSYLYYCISDGPYGYDKNEVEQIKAYKPDSLKCIKNTEILEHVYTYLEKTFEFVHAKLKNDKILK